MATSAATTTGTLADLRCYFPTSRWTDEQLQAALDATDDVIARARLYLWRHKHAELLADPDQWTANGDYSESHRHQMAAVKREIVDLENLLGEGALAEGFDPKLPTLAGGAPLVRPDRSLLFNGQRTRDTSSSADVSSSLYGLTERR